MGAPLMKQDPVIPKPRRPRRGMRWTGFAVVVVGLACSVYGAGLFQNRLGFRNAAVEADGTVTANIITRSSQSPDGPATYAPAFEFIVDGQRYNVVSTRAWGSEQYVTGDSVRVLYHPANPRQAVLADAAPSVAWPAVLVGLGVAGAGFGAFLVRRGLRPSPL